MLNSHESLNDRMQSIEKWHTENGILIMGYAMFRILVDDVFQTDDLSEDEEKIKQMLIDPGPDRVICDEGHLLKNDKTSLNDVLSNIRTDRHFNRSDLDYLYSIENIEPKNDDFNELPSDSILSKLLNDMKGTIVKYHSHDSLLENKSDESLSPEERKLAWEEYKSEEPQGTRAKNSIRFPSIQIGNTTIIWTKLHENNFISFFSKKIGPGLVLPI